MIYQLMNDRLAVYQQAEINGKTENIALFECQGTKDGSNLGIIDWIRFKFLGAFQEIYLGDNAGKKVHIFVDKKEFAKRMDQYFIDFGACDYELETLRPFLNRDSKAWTDRSLFSVYRDIRNQYAQKLRNGEIQFKDLSTVFRKDPVLVKIACDEEIGQGAKTRKVENLLHVTDQRYFQNLERVVSIYQRNSRLLMNPRVVPEGIVDCVKAVTSSRRLYIKESSPENLKLMKEIAKVQTQAVSLIDDHNTLFELIQERPDLIGNIRRGVCNYHQLMRRLYDGIPEVRNQTAFLIGLLNEGSSLGKNLIRDEDVIINILKVDMSLFTRVDQTIIKRPSFLAKFATIQDLDKKITPRIMSELLDDTIVLNILRKKPEFINYVSSHLLENENFQRKLVGIPGIQEHLNEASFKRLKDRSTVKFFAKAIPELTRLVESKAILKELVIEKKDLVTHLSNPQSLGEEFWLDVVVAHPELYENLPLDLKDQKPFLEHLFAKCFKPHERLATYKFGKFLEIMPHIRSIPFLLPLIVHHPELSINIARSVRENPEYGTKANLFSNWATRNDHIDALYYYQRKFEPISEVRINGAISIALQFPELLSKMHPYFLEHPQFISALTELATENRQIIINLEQHNHDLLATIIEENPVLFQHLSPETYGNIRFLDTMIFKKVWDFREFTPHVTNVEFLAKMTIRSPKYIYPFINPEIKTNPEYIDRVSLALQIRPEYGFKYECERIARIVLIQPHLSKYVDAAVKDDPLFNTIMTRLKER